MLKYGVDCSHHQPVDFMRWDLIGASAQFAIVRNSYGTTKDKLTNEHLKRARAAGLKVGCYHFFRPSQDATAQLDVFLHGLDAAGIGPGDIAPALDIELDPFPKATPVTKAWQDGVRAILSGLRDKYGNALVYITQREFNMLGAPEWLLSFPLWVAHYSGAAKPATPGNRPFAIWQHRVGPYLFEGPGGYDKAHPLLDQNRAADLPLIVNVARRTIPLPAPTGDDDTGLEEAIAEHNQHLMNEVTELEYSKVQDELNRGAAHALREYEEAGLVDDDSGGGSNQT